MDFLSIIASILSMLSMGIYFLGLTKGKSTPNPSTWITWLLIGCMNVFTYFYVTEGNFQKAFPLLFVVIGIFCVTLYSIKNGCFSKLNRLDYVCLASALITTIYWQVTGNALIANLLLQAVYVISFIPTVVGLHRKTISETPAPWFFAITSYSIMIVMIFNDWGQNSWIELAHPVLNGLMGNGAVLYYVIKNRPRKIIFKPVKSQKILKSIFDELNREVVG